MAREMLRYLEDHPHETPMEQKAAIAAVTILVVEDDSMLLALLAQALAQSGYHVLTAQEGPKALRLSQTHPGPIHLLLTDLVLPQKKRLGLDASPSRTAKTPLSGPELARQILVQRPDMDVLFITGHNDDTIRSLGVNQDSPILKKPFSVDCVVRKVREMLLS
jgi:two-component system cell cycle sensor histidine kinase/response regulator CckA